MIIDWTGGLVGGFLIGLAAALFLLLSGRITGISGMIGGALKSPLEGSGWRIAYLAGLPLGVTIVALVAPQWLPEIEISSSWPLLIAAGVLVGYGARLGNGCTSGHGVCGVSRLSSRSLLSTAIFFSVAAVTVLVMRHLLPG